MQMLNFSTYCIFMFTGIKFCQFYNYKLHFTFALILIYFYKRGITYIQSYYSTKHFITYCLFMALSRVRLCDPMDCRASGSSLHGILQARILEWVAMPSSRGSSQPRDRIQVSSCRQFSSVTQLCPNLCSPMDLWHARPPCPSPTPGIIQTQVHLSCDDIQPSHPLPSPSPTFSLSQNQNLFQWVSRCIRWPKYWSFSFSTSSSNEYSGLISFRTDWLDLLAVQGTLKSLL